MNEPCRAGHCKRSKDELISDVLLWIPTYRSANFGQPVKGYLHQLFVDTGCNLDDLLGAMDDRDRWQMSQVTL